MPKNHKRFPYIEKLIEEKNVEALEREAKCIQRILDDYKELLLLSLTSEDKEKIIKHVEQQKKLLNYVNSAIEKILSSKSK